MQQDAVCLLSEDDVMLLKSVYVNHKA